MRDYVKWHGEYDDPNSNLSRRLARVRRLIAEELSARRGPIRFLSLCSGDGRDILGVLDDSPADIPRVGGRLVELDPTLAGNALGHIAALGSPLEVVQGDASDPQNLTGTIPADLVLLVGIMGNISEDDVLYLAGAAATLCAPGACLIWTRGGEYADLNARIQSRLTEAGFTDQQFFAEPPHKYRVGIARASNRAAPPLRMDRPLFTFTR